MNTRFNKHSDEGTTRKVIRRLPEAKAISITSLLDALTIILVFLIKNMSMDPLAKMPESMIYPTTISREELMKTGVPLVIKIYNDKVTIGANDLYVGTPTQLMSDPDTRTRIRDFMLNDAKRTADSARKKRIDFRPVLLIQADEQVLCVFVSTVIKIAASNGYEDIYFASIYDDAWLTKSANRVQ